MESLCYLQSIDNLARSTVDPPLPATPPFLINPTVIGAIGGKLAMISAQRYPRHMPAIKRRRTEFFDNSSGPNEHFLSPNVNIEVSEEVILDRNDCFERSVTKSVCRDLQYGEMRPSQLESSEAGKLKYNFLPVRNIDRSPLWFNVHSNDATARSLSCPTFGASKEHLSGTGEDCRKKIIQNSQYEPEVQRCRSLPCRMTPDHQKNELQRYYHSAPFLSPHVNLSESSTDETSNDKNEACGLPYQTSGDDNEKVERNDEESSSSGSETPASCFIDVEDDTAPSSPLNLSTNDNECHDSKKDIADDISNSSEPITVTSQRSPIPRQENNSNFLKSDDSVLHTEQCANQTDTPVGQTASNEILQEKKTNFSIDAILRPDFGVIRPAIQATDQLQHRNNQTSSPRIRPQIKSSHSAFTAVDLSTRSRSDSLSSPSCSSSSSPSPPLSTSSPSPLLKSELKHSALYGKHYIGQENILLASKLFPEPNKHFQHFLNSHIPFMNPLHPNGLKTFPFMYTSQNGHPPRLPSVRNSTNPAEYRTKADNEKTTSKLLGRSFYPFANEPSAVLKLSAQQESHIKTGNGPAFHVLGQNKHRPNSIDSLPPSKAEKSQNTNSQSKLAIRNHDMSVKPDKSTAANCKVELKQERAGHGDNKEEDSSGNSSNGNALWPAWVFCTRYSDRPSSGPRSRKPKRSRTQDEKRPRTAFTNEQLARLKREFEDCRYLTETRRKHLADELGLTESQIKIWFQNKRAKIKKSVGVRNPLALQLMEQGLYNHTTVKSSDESS